LLASRLRHHVLVPPDRNLFPLDVRGAQRIDDIIRYLVGNIDQREAIVDLACTDDVGIQRALTRALVRSRRSSRRRPLSRNLLQCVVTRTSVLW
jgi:hypothetical protein